MGAGAVAAVGVHNRDGRQPGGSAEMAEGCPILGSGGSIEVYETFQIM